MGATVVTITGADVIHSWTIPAFGVKTRRGTGSFAQLWFNAGVEGIYFIVLSCAARPCVYADLMSCAS
jgi:cytochrome c oxidase subunit 2